MLAPRMCEISVVSSINLLVNTGLDSLASFSKFSQYIDSLALFNAISKNFLNSNFELAAEASVTLAPMLVPHLIN